MITQISIIGKYPICSTLGERGGDGGLGEREGKVQKGGMGGEGERKGRGGRGEGKGGMVPTGGGGD